MERRVNKELHENILIFVYIYIMHCVYILESLMLNRFYIGYSFNLEERLTFHECSESRKYTYKATDWTLFFKIECESMAQALAIERHIKQMKSKTYIENLKKYPEMAQKLLDRYKFKDC